MIFSLLLWTISGLFLFIVLILTLPFRLAFIGTCTLTEEKRGLTGKICLGGIRYGLAINLYPEKRVSVGNYRAPLFYFSFPHKKTKPKSKTKKVTKRGGSIPYLQILKAVLKTIHLEWLELKGTLGLANPMHTGMLYGYSLAVKNIIPQSKFSISLEPNFINRLNTNLTGNIRLQFRPTVVAWKAIITYFKFKT